MNNKKYKCTCGHITTFLIYGIYCPACDRRIIKGDHIQDGVWTPILDDGIKEIAQ